MSGRNRGIKSAGLNTIPANDDSELAQYWRSRGGTISALPYTLSPVDEDPDMTMWISISSELTTGEGIMPRPIDIDAVLEWHRDKIDAWFSVMFPRVSRSRRLTEISRFLISKIFQGKASAHFEKMSEHSRKSRRTPVTRHGR